MGSDCERAGMVGKQSAAHAAKEKTFESANQVTNSVKNLPCSQERPPAGRAGGPQGAHQRQPPCGAAQVWLAPFTVAAKGAACSARAGASLRST